MRIKQSFCLPLFKPDGMSPDEIAAAVLRRREDFEELVAAAKRPNLVVASMIVHGSVEDGLNRGSNHERIEADRGAAQRV